MERLPRINFDESAARAWLAKQHVTDDDYGVADDRVVEIDDRWSPRYDLAGDSVSSSDVYDLVYNAGKQPDIYTADDGSDVKPVFFYDHDDDGGAYLWQAGFTTTDGLPPLYVGTVYEEYRKLGDPELVGVDAAVVVLQEAVDGANSALIVLEQYLKRRQS